MKLLGESLILGIESSCDETAAAVVAGGRRVLSNVIASQIDLHKKYGGVVPEIASRKHLEAVLPVIKEALATANVTLADVDAIAVTHGPGLVGTLLVGLSAAKALAYATDKPLVGVNHLHGHIAANFLREDPPEFPLVCLVVSGGHTDLIYMTGHGQMELLGRTRDDAAGEAFDKAARSVGLGYPGGPQVEKLAALGNPEAVPLPQARTEGPYDFSFSGLKTAVLQYAQKKGPLDDQQRADLAASFQRAVTGVLADKTLKAARAMGVRQVIMAGGVASNGALRRAMADALTPHGIRLGFPPPILCTDNAAMIAAAGHFLFEAGVRSNMDLNASPSLGLL
ncbi:MAG TPA: tRNA (adenosine(37)-N6)-threonylcarbamoyltransferase complex transferase subunit TsaD [Symbiobacteriaceae bacterium]|nr:tRNA (adenosine(37)-N6)-threonylcarbamoyltransferase complex transferase subunit TsaD [Symbiobacteriaceae bacterium]